MVEKQILNTIDQHDLIQEQQHIVLGLSGGPDSVCLFHVLSKLAPKRKWTLHPVHINHRLRPGDAEKDQAYAEALCKDFGFSCRVFVYDCSEIARKEKLTAEEAGRKVRYEAFAETAKALQDSGIRQKDICIAVAQNADDQAETILFRLLRGSGTDGLAGIRYERTDEKGNRIIRPLLDVKKADILQYCQDYDLHPRIDHTNEEPTYTRNKIRLKLIPYLAKEYNPVVSDTMIRMGRSAAADSDYIWQQARSALDTMVIKETDRKILLQGSQLRGIHRAVRQRIMAAVFSRLGLSEEFTAVHFENCEKILFHPGPSARCDLPKGFYFAKVYENIEAGFRPVQKEKEECRLPELRVTVLGKGRDEMEKLRRSEQPAYQNLRAVFDYDKMRKVFGEEPECRITAAFRTAGDFIRIGESRSKKIQDYFVDQKVPKMQRDQIALVKIGREVLWVVPDPDGAVERGRFSAAYKLDGETKKVICIEIIC